MSLLMQALKKAERTKQTKSDNSGDDAHDAQAAQPMVDEAMSLSPKDAAVEPLASTVAETAPYDTPTVPQELALTPHYVSASSVGDAQEDLIQASPEPTSTAMSADNIKNSQTENSATKSKTEDANTAEKDLPHAASPITGAEHKIRDAEEKQRLLSHREKAKSVFSAKIPENTSQKRSFSKLSFGAVGLLIGLLSSAGFLYWQNASVPKAIFVSQPQTMSPSTVASEAAANPEPPATNAKENGLPVAAPVTGAPVSTSTPASAAVAAQMNASGTAPQSPISPISPIEMRPHIQKPVRQNAVPDDVLAAKLVNARPKIRAPKTLTDNDSDAIQIKKNSNAAQINPSLVGAYKAFIAGDTQSAQQQYRKVLQQEPNNRDALLGLAAIALNQRQAEQAGAYYEKLIELDPNDPDAIAGLTSLQQDDPVQSESRLKRNLQQHPQAGAVLFALGNLYAQQSRWSDAQQTYFRAYTSAPNNADYAFNLAVSLDRLGQIKLAKEFYQRALTLGQSGPGNFSRDGVQKRIAELEETTKN